MTVLSTFNWWFNTFLIFLLHFLIALRCRFFLLLTGTRQLWQFRKKFSISKSESYYMCLSMFVRHIKTATDSPQKVWLFCPIKNTVNWWSIFVKNQFFLYTYCIGNVSATLHCNRHLETISFCFGQNERVGRLKSKF